MKKYIKQKLHLSEVLKSISYIEVCRNATMSPRRISAAEDFDPDMYDSIENDKLLLRISDENLPKISTTRMAMVTDGEVLHRLNSVCPELLLPDQIDMLQQYYSDTELEIDEDDVAYFLEKLKSCTNLIYKKTQKNEAFLLDFGKQVRKDDCFSILKSLEVSDCKEWLLGADPKYFGDNLLVFRKYIDWTMSTGDVLNDIYIYIKLDLDKSDGDCVVIVSFHEADYDN